MERGGRVGVTAQVRQVALRSLPPPVDGGIIGRGQVSTGPPPNLSSAVVRLMDSHRLTISAL